MGRYYILRDDEVIEEPDYSKWIKWYDSTYMDVRCISQTMVKYGIVSTIFLGLNMTLSKNDSPLVFETKVEGGWLDGEYQRYSELAEAKAGHEAWVARVRAEEEEHKLPPPGCPVW